MKLVVKDNCKNCEWVKGKIPNGMKIDMVNGETPDGLALLAFHEKIDNGNFPFLITDDDKVIEGTINIKNEIINKNV